jgi:hypothetical protein
MRRTHFTVPLSTLACALFLTAGCRSADPPASAPPAAGSGAAAAPGAGMKAYVDPQTGKLTEQPPPGAEPVPGDVLTPPAGVERPVAGGGTQLDLDPKAGDESDDDD